MFLLMGRVSLVPCPFQGVGVLYPPPKRHGIRDRTRTTKAGGTHPTGMLSCIDHYLCFSVKSSEGIGAEVYTDMLQKYMTPYITTQV